MLTWKILSQSPPLSSPYHSFDFVEFCSGILIFLLFFIACLSHNGMWAPLEQLICVIRAEILVSRTVPTNINIYGQNRAFPGSSVVNNPPPNAGDVKDTGSVSGSGRSPGGELSNPLPSSAGSSYEAPQESQVELPGLGNRFGHSLEVVWGWQVRKWGLPNSPALALAPWGPSRRVFLLSQRCGCLPGSSLAFLCVTWVSPTARCCCDSAGVCRHSLSAGVPLCFTKRHIFSPPSNNESMINHQKGSRRLSHSTTFYSHMTLKRVVIV